MICAPTVAEAQAWAEDMTWFWTGQFGQGLPLLLVGSPDTISRKIEAASKRILIKECFLLIPQGVQSSTKVCRAINHFSKQVCRGGHVRC